MKFTSGQCCLRTAVRPLPVTRSGQRDLLLSRNCTDDCKCRQKECKETKTCHS